VPSIGASLAAILAGWVIDGVFGPYLGTGATLILSFAGSTVVFFVALRWLKKLRDGT
jgi:uncharacterized membrane protein YdjX (TVP38/TMEM64 family)